MKPSNTVWKGGGKWEYNEWGELVQSTLHACIELTQWNPLILLIYANSKINFKKKAKKLFHKQLLNPLKWQENRRHVTRRKRVASNMVSIFTLNINIPTSQSFSLFFWEGLLRTEPRASYSLGKCSTNWVVPQLYPPLSFKWLSWMKSRDRPR
jgi:hypothetical protein